jgi:DNA invertase Pin-like site-specific DNA recombinase
MEKRIYGYVRVSDKDQNEQRQIQALLEFGVQSDLIFKDKQSGKDFNRPDYILLTQKVLHEGDLLVVLSIDRLGRNYTEIMEQWRYITQTIRADIKVLDMPLLDTTQASNTLDSRFVADLVLQILSYVAQKERESIKKRQQQGIDVMPIIDGKKVSSKTGKPIGRPQAEYPEKWQEVYTQWKTGNITAVTAFQSLELTKNTFYNLVKRYESKQ